MRTYTREKDVVVRTDTETFPAIADYQAILDSVEVRPDEFDDPPWETCDGLEHTRDGEEITIPWNESLERYYRERGASKQVAKQLTARSMAKRREYLASVYANGCEVWGVSCDFQGFHDSVWGVDDYESARGEMSEEIALNVASEMQAAGFDVVNLPDRCPNRQRRRNVHLFDWRQHQWTT